MTKREMINELIEELKNNKYIDIAKQKRYYNSLKKKEIENEYSYMIEYKYCD